MAPPTVSLLGPQRPKSNLSATVREVVPGDPTIPVAAITAGWQEYESDGADLDEHLDRPVRNLDLWRRSDEVFARYPHFRDGLWRRKELLDQLQVAYRVQLGGALESVRTLQELALTNPETASPYLMDAVTTLQDIDRQHCDRMAQLTAEFDAGQGYGSNDEIVRHRAEIGLILQESPGLLIAGGHVLVLMNRLRIFALADALEQADFPVIAWSAGAMALTDRVVLFHHSPPQGSNDTAVSAAGLGCAPGLVAFPDAKHRLDLANPARVELLARRFGGAQCVTLDAGERIDWDGSQWRSHSRPDEYESVRLLTPAGHVEKLEGPCPR